MLEGYIRELKAHTAELNRQREKAKVKLRNGDTRVLCDKPLTEQIVELMRSLPPAQRDRPWSMEEFLVRLLSRSGRRPHPMYVGQALREIGWVSKRDWTRDGGGRRVWHNQPIS